MSLFNHMPMEPDFIYSGETKRKGFIVYENTYIFMNGEAGEVDIHLAYVFPKMADGDSGHFVPVHYVDGRLCLFPSITLFVNTERLYRGFLRSLEFLATEKIYCYVWNNYTNFHCKHYEF